MIPDRKSIQRGPSQLIVITLALTITTFGWVVWNAYASYRDAGSHASGDLRVEELRGVILRLDEVLTMSARMAAATGDLRWEARYHQFEPTLDAAIKEAMAIAPGPAAIAGSTQTNLANAKLVAMEKAAFALIRAGRAEDARAVLFGQAYEEQKALYASGMAGVLTDVRARVDAGLQRTTQRVLLSMAGAAVLLGMSIAAWLAVIGSLRRTQGELTSQVDQRTSALTLANEALRGEIAERQLIQADLVEARDAALDGARQKAEFLANMSHEIRTPMNGVVGMAGLLLETELTPEQREFATTISTSGDALLTLINDILDFSKVEAGKLTFEMLDFDLEPTIEGAVDLLVERAAAKDIELAVLVERAVPTALRGDAGRLRQVIVNLLGNAVKFTERGEVLVRVSLELETPVDALLRVEVRDSGIGIAGGEQSRLFEAFTQADSSTTRKFGGTGLGLAISKRLVELMGGEIGVRSVEGHGATFWFTARFEKQTGAVQTRPVPATGLVGHRVLVVDDNETNRQILHLQLGAWGIDDEAVSSGVDALAALRAAAGNGRPFHLAILDFQMPGMDGIMLARAIKTDEAIASVLLIMMTSLAREDEAELRAAGVMMRLTKPVKQGRLRASLERALGMPIQPGPRAAAPPLASAPRRHTRILVAEDNRVNQKVALLQLRQLGYAADGVANGAEVLEALTRIPYGLVLMDCQMPEVDGYEATRLIRQQETTTGRGHIPVIAMTAHALAGEREKCVQAGMDDFISKPVKVADLDAVLSRWDAERGSQPAGAGVTD